MWRVMGWGNDIDVVTPHRLEIETNVLHSSELTDAVARVVRALRLRGITVYAQTPLLGHINDNADEMLRISHACRELGIEYTTVFVAGTPLQRRWNAEHPVDLNVVIDIGTQLRCFGSGREVPRYVVRTGLGEVDFSITPRIFSLGEDGQVHVTLRPHDQAYYRALDPEFPWPPEVALDGDGHPVVPIDGVRLDNPLFLAGPRRTE